MYLVGYIKTELEEGHGEVNMREGGEDSQGRYYVSLSEHVKFSRIGNYNKR